MAPHWTPDEDQKLRDLYKDHTDGEIGDIVNKSTQSVTNRRRRLGLIKKRPWTDKDDKTLTRLVGEGHTYPEIGNLMNKPVKVIDYRIGKLGLRNRRGPIGANYILQKVGVKQS